MAVSHGNGFRGYGITTKRSGGSLGKRDLTTLSNAVAAIAPDWTVELNHVFAGETSLVIMPEDADDALGPTFIIRRMRDRYCLDQFHWDDYCELGTFSHMREVVSTVRTHIARLHDMPPLPSKMRH